MPLQSYFSMTGNHRLDQLLKDSLWYFKRTKTNLASAACCGNRLVWTCMILMDALLHQRKRLLTGSSISSFYILHCPLQQLLIFCIDFTKKVSRLVTSDLSANNVIFSHVTFSAQVAENSLKSLKYFLTILSALSM